MGHSHAARGDRLQSADGLDPAEVARFLLANPGFLAATPGLYAALDPPRRLHGDAAADHMAARIAAEQARADAATAQARQHAAADRRVQAAVLALLRSAHPIDCATQEWPSLLGVDAIMVWAEGDMPGARSLPPGAVAAALGGGASLVRNGATPGLHGEATRLAIVEGLARIPWRRPALLAVACRDGAALAGAAVALSYLARALAAALERP